MCEHNNASRYHKSYRAGPLKTELRYNMIMKGKESRYGYCPTDVLIDVVKRPVQKRNGHIIIKLQSLESGRAPRELHWFENPSSRKFKQILDKASMAYS